MSRFQTYTSNWKTDTLSAVTIKCLKSAFPNAETKIATKTQTMHVLGITPVNEASSSQPTITQMLESERAVNRELLGKIQVLEAKIQELERTSVENLVQQAQALPHTSLTACGPDSYEHFHGFSIDGVICELKEKLPDLYALVMQLADVKRNVEVPNNSSSQGRVCSLHPAQYPI